MLRALRAEFLKLRRARVLLWTALTVAVVPSVTGSSMRIIDGGPTAATWESFMRLAPQMMASWWAIPIFGLAAAYIFGREFSDGTAKNMLTLPIRRESFIFAKLIVLAVWVLGLTAFSIALQALGAVVFGLPGFAWIHIQTAAVESLQIAGLVYATLPVVAALAMLERGYFPPMIFSAFVATAAFMVGAVGWGSWFPWSMPLAVIGTAFGPLIEKPTLYFGSFVIDAVVFLVGLAAMLIYIDRADNTQ